MHAGEIAGHQREEVAWFRMGIMPDGEVPVGSRNASALPVVAVGQQDGAQGLARFHAHRVARHHIGAVVEIGNAPEAFRLALGAVHGVGLVKARERRVTHGVAFGFNLKREARGGNLWECETIIRQRIG